MAGKKYSIITDYIPLLRNDRFASNVTYNDNGRICDVKYTKTANDFWSVLFRRLKKIHGPSCNDCVLQCSGCPKTSEMSLQCVIARFKHILNSGHYNGEFLAFLRNGTIIELLQRLNELDGLKFDQNNRTALGRTAFSPKFDFNVPSDAYKSASDGRILPPEDLKDDFYIALFEAYVKAKELGLVLSSECMETSGVYFFSFYDEDKMEYTDIYRYVCRTDEWKKTGEFPPDIERVNQGYNRFALEFYTNQDFDIAGVCLKLIGQVPFLEAIRSSSENITLNDICVKEIAKIIMRNMQYLADWKHEKLDLYNYRNLLEQRGVSRNEIWDAETAEIDLQGILAIIYGAVRYSITDDNTHLCRVIADGRMLVWLKRFRELAEEYRKVYCEKNSDIITSEMEFWLRKKLKKNFKDVAYMLPPERNYILEKLEAEKNKTSDITQRNFIDSIISVVNKIYKYFPEAVETISRAEKCVPGQITLYEAAKLAKAHADKLNVKLSDRCSVLADGWIFYFCNSSRMCVYDDTEHFVSLTGRYEDVHISKPITEPICPSINIRPYLGPRTPWENAAKRKYFWDEWNVKYGYRQSREINLQHAIFTAENKSMKYDLNIAPLCIEVPDGWFFSFLTMDNMPTDEHSGFFVTKYNLVMERDISNGIPYKENECKNRDISRYIPKETDAESRQAACTDAFMRLVSYACQNGDTKTVKEILDRVTPEMNEGLFEKFGLHFENLLNMHEKQYVDFAVRILMWENEAKGTPEEKLVADIAACICDMMNCN